ncbi:MAG TPA: ankyrin repeat domain-containing protein, partial [Burkholderiales bacterium]
LGLPSNSVLNRAVEGGNPEVVKSVLQAGADPNARGETGMTPLMMAAFFGKPSIIDVLLDHGADPGLIENRRRDTALLIAVNRGHTGVVRSLINGKVDANQGSEWGRSPLCEATSRGLADIEKLLVEAGGKCHSTTQKK